VELCVCVLCFFFQAEDGIRDKLVTGVQTCALPIFVAGLAREWLVKVFADGILISCQSCDEPFASRPGIGHCFKRVEGLRRNYEKIGRASCRERVENGGLAEDVEKKHKLSDGDGRGA